MSSFKQYEGPLTTIGFLVIVGIIVIVIGLVIIGPVLYQMGILSFEGAAAYVSDAINFTFQSGYGFLSPLGFSDNSIMFQIYCDDNCASYLRYLYRKGIVLKDSLFCEDSFCICLGTLKAETKDEFFSNRDLEDEYEYNGKIHYRQGINAQEILGRNNNGIYKYFIYDGSGYFQSFNCAPSKTFMVVDNGDCSVSNKCYQNVLTYVYAYGTYSFSANMEKSSNNIGVVIKE